MANLCGEDRRGDLGGVCVGKYDQNILYKIPKKQNRKRNKAEKHRVEPQKLQMKF